MAAVVKPLPTTSRTADDAESSSASSSPPSAAAVPFPPRDAGALVLNTNRLAGTGVLSPGRELMGALERSVRYLKRGLDVPPEASPRQQRPSDRAAAAPAPSACHLWTVKLFVRAGAASAEAMAEAVTATKRALGTDAIKTWLLALEGGSDDVGELASLVRRLQRSALLGDDEEVGVGVADVSPAQLRALLDAECVPAALQVGTGISPRRAEEMYAMTSAHDIRVWQHNDARLDELVPQDALNALLRRHFSGAGPDAAVKWAVSYKLLDECRATIESRGWLVGLTPV